ncbi:MAG: hypothetical protein JWN29_2392 [Acidimicrobiales bacterium]|nr:hypothetical protein [Acidimicrobiales bacterium]
MAVTTTPTLVPKDLIIDALSGEFAALDVLLSDVDDAGWKAPSPCPGWDVRAVVAHIIGTESMLAGAPTPDITIDRDAAPHVRNDIGAFNEAWVAALAELPTSELLERFRAITATRLDALRSMDEPAWDAVGPTPAGPDSYGRFMRIRVFDCWMHEQDIRDAVGRPGHDAGPAVDLTLDEMTGALGFIVGKKSGAPPDTDVTFNLTGGSGRQIHVHVGERAAVVDSLPGLATVTITMPVGEFTRLGGGRVHAGDVWVELDGDTALGRHILENLAYTI